MAPLAREPIIGRLPLLAGEGSLHLEDAPLAPRLQWNSAEKRYDRGAPWNYEPPTHYTLETLQIRSGGRGVVLGGKGNALRDSVVEVDSEVAVVSYGPGVVIEGNTFIVHLGKDVYTAPETTALLKLRDADGAVIRNNRFIVKHWRGKARAAINLIDSRDVLIENNVVEGADVLVRRDAASTTVERGNMMK